MNICMTRPNLEDLPPVTLPAGYALATAADFSDPAPLWVAVVNNSFGDTNWTVDSVTRDFISQPQYHPEGVFFVVHQGQPVATAFAWVDHPDERRLGRVHFVGTIPDHRGKGLARAVVLSVLHYLRERGFQQAFLETQGFRLGAIRLYLALGFQPTPRSDQEAQVWAEVMRQLEA